MKTECGIIYSARFANGKEYIGKHINVNLMRYARNHHKHFADHGGARLISRAIRKHGFDSIAWTVLEYCPLPLLSEREIFWISDRGSLTPNGYNMTAGGEGGDCISNHPDKDEITARISEQQKVVQNRSEVKKKRSESMRRYYEANPDAKKTRSRTMKEHRRKNRRRHAVRTGRTKPRRPKGKRKKLTPKLPNM